MIRRHFFGGPWDGQVKSVPKDATVHAAFGHSRMTTYVLRRVRLKHPDGQEEIVAAFVPADEEVEQYRERFLALRSTLGLGPDLDRLLGLKGLFGGMFG